MYTWKFKNEGRHNVPHLLILYLSFYIMFFTGQQVIPGCPFYGIEFPCIYFDFGRNDLDYKICTTNRFRHSGKAAH